MGSDIPRARRALLIVARDLATRGDTDTHYRILRIIADCMIKSRKETDRALTPEKIRGIKILHEMEPALTQPQIAAHFGINVGRVSEVLRGLHG